MSDASAIAARGRVRAVERANAQVSVDANADARVDPRVLDVYLDACSVFADARASHAAGAEARRLVADARERIAGVLVCEPSELFFTSGGTEADALALAALGRPLAVSAIEHAAISKEARALGAAIVPVGRGGRVCVEDVPTNTHVSILAASNEMGTLQPVDAIADAVHSRGYLMHTDAIQMPGRAPCTVRALGADFVTFSAHKIGAPGGLGLLVAKRPLVVDHVWPAENVAGIVAMARAFELLPDEGAMRAVADTRDAFEAHVVRDIEDAEVIGRAEPRLSNTSCMVIPGCPGEALLMALDIAGYAVSTGSACASGSIDASPVLMGIGLSSKEARNSVRFSFAEPLDVAALAERVVQIVREVRAGP